MIRIQVFSPDAEGMIERPDNSGEREYGPVTLDMLNGGRLYVQGAKRYPDAHEMIPALGVKRP